MIPRNLDSGDHQWQTLWQALGDGAPTISGFASLCSAAMSQTVVPELDDLSSEAKALLLAAAERGTLEIRVSKDEFDSSLRLLAVAVEQATGSWLLFRQPDNPRKTIEFLEGFRQLCLNGLVLHHLQREFSLSAAGFNLAATLSVEDFQPLLDSAVTVGH